MAYDLDSLDRVSRRDQTQTIRITNKKESLCEMIKMLRELTTLSLTLLFSMSSNHPQLSNPLSNITPNVSNRMKRKI